MARALNLDYFHNFRFKVLDTNKVIAGAFSAISIPDISIEPAEYRDGTMVYTRKQPGIVTVDNATLSRGVVKNDTQFKQWLDKCIDGDVDYRIDFTVQHIHRDKTTRNYKFLEAFANRVKLSSDLDASDSGIGVSEIEVVAEEIQVESGTTT
jgi:phage tail-like protein